MVSAITGRLNNYAIDNGDVEVQHSEFPVELKSESIPGPNTTSIKSITDDEMYYILEFFHSQHDEDLMDVAIHMLQA